MTFKDAILRARSGLTRAILTNNGSVARVARHVGLNQVGIKISSYVFRVLMMVRSLTMFESGSLWPAKTPTDMLTEDLVRYWLHGDACG
jgi:hypothetical protein